MIIAEGDEGFLQPPVEAFDEAIGLRMIRSGHLYFHSPRFRKLLKSGGAKLTTAVGGDCRRNPKMGNPAICEGLTYALSRDVYKRNGDGPTCEAVDCCEQVLEPV